MCDFGISLSYSLGFVFLSYPDFFSRHSVGGGNTFFLQCCIMDKCNFLMKLQQTLFFLNAKNAVGKKVAI